MTDSTRRILIEEELWKPREDETSEYWNGYRNLWPLTDAKDDTHTHLRQSAGINPVGRVSKGAGRGRRPAVAIFIKPEGDRHSLPWLDEVDLETGFVRYFGDNRPGKLVPPEKTEGNRALLTELDLYSSSSQEDRLRAGPLLFFRNLGSEEGTPFTQFLGFGLIKAAHRVTQLHKRRTFSNYVYDCVLLHGDEDSTGQQMFDVGWLDDRRNPDLADSETLRAAPKSWRRWVRDGSEVIEARDVRRYVDRVHRLAKSEQLPVEKSALGGTLNSIYTRYDGNYKHGFQALAALATEQVLAASGIGFHRGWVTPVGPDGGVDFVQRLDVGVGASQTRLVVLGQAKCKKPWSSGVTAEELSRVVARLRRGWIGSFVTTSFYTDSAQRELVVDEYPIVLIHGLQLARTVELIRDARGLASVSAVLDWVDDEYDALCRAARPHPSDILRQPPGREPLPASLDEAEA